LGSGTEAAARFTAEIIAKCEHLALLPGLLGRGRPELRADIRSAPFKGYLIFFRYLPSKRERNILEIVDILEGHRDLIAYFTDLHWAAPSARCASVPRRPGNFPFRIEIIRSNAPIAMDRGTIS
jgi:plasmid stabilization system protein ParE